MRKRRGHLERTIEHLQLAIERAQSAERLSARNGLLQRIAPRVKVIGLVALAVSVSFASNLWALGFVFAVAVLLAALSHLSPATLAIRVWSGALAFTGTIAAPALVLVPGDVMWRLPLVHWPITTQGLTAVVYLVLRVETTATLVCLLIFTTPWPHVLKALRTLGVPAVFVVVLGMMYRYILLLLETAHQMFESRRSRAAGGLSPSDGRRLAMNATGALFEKTLYLSDEVYLAMQSRGFRGEIHVLEDFRLQGRDWAALALLLGTAVLAGWTGR